MSALGNTGNDPETSSVTFSLAAPMAWTNNAGYSDDDTRSAFHVSPAAQVKASKTIGDVRLEGRASLGSDIYSRAEENNLSFLQARFQLSVAHAGPWRFTPYFRYRARAEYSDSFFGEYDSTIHDFSVGGTKDISAFFKVPVTLDLFVLRRESTSAGRERWQPGATASAEGSFGHSQWGWSLEQSIQGRFFTAGANEGRNDFYASTYGGITLNIGRKWKLTVAEATLEWNSSDAADRDYLVLNVGASLSASF